MMCKDTAIILYLALLLTVSVSDIRSVLHYWSEDHSHFHVHNVQSLLIVHFVARSLFKPYKLS